MDDQQLIEDFRKQCEDLYNVARSNIIRLTPLGGLNRPVGFDDFQIFHTHSTDFYNKMDQAAKAIESNKPNLTPDLDRIVKGYIVKLDQLATNLKNRRGR